MHVHFDISKATPQVLLLIVNKRGANKDLLDLLAHDLSSETLYFHIRSTKVAILGILESSLIGRRGIAFIRMSLIW